MSTSTALESADQIKGPTMSNHPNRSQANRSLTANPTAAEVRAARIKVELTQAAAAEVIHATTRSWENWEMEGAEGRRMHPGLFELFLAKTGQLRKEYYDRLLEAKAKAQK
jgi:DNA-binding transcriptional regulator YiaG